MTTDTTAAPDAATAAAPDPGEAASTPGTALARVSSAEIAALLDPYTIDEVTWLRGILSTDDFPAMDPDAVMAGMLAQILMATTSEQALASLELDRARDLCGNEPGGRSPVLEISGVRPMKSDYAEGPACYVIVSAIRLDTGDRIQFSTGSKGVQTVLWKMAHEGWLPFRAALEIRRERTQAGFHPLNLVAGV